MGKERERETMETFQPFNDAVHEKEMIILQIVLNGNKHSVWKTECYWTMVRVVCEDGWRTSIDPSNYENRNPNRQCFEFLLETPYHFCSTKSNLSILWYRRYRWCYLMLCRLTSIRRRVILEDEGNRDMNINPSIYRVRTKTYLVYE